VADTWDYRADNEGPQAVIPDAWVWERLRLRRDAMLVACDFRIVADAPWEITPWTAYREELRTLPENTTDPRKAVWPIEPQEVKR
jgi:hypothetical protein